MQLSIAESYKIKDSVLMVDANANCALCRGVAGGPEIQRIQVWEDSLRRVTVSLDSEVEGFAYLEPKRHISYITDLNGEEARTFGQVLARVSRAKKLFGGERVGAQDQTY